MLAKIALAIVTFAVVFATLVLAAGSIPPQKQLECVYAAKELEQEGQFDWAVREYKRTIEKQPPETLDHFIARIWLPSLLHDYEHDQEAAEAIATAVSNLTCF